MWILPHTVLFETRAYCFNHNACPPATLCAQPQVEQLGKVERAPFKTLPLESPVGVKAQSWTQTFPAQMFRDEPKRGSQGWWAEEGKCLREKKSLALDLYNRVWGIISLEGWERSSQRDCIHQGPEAWESVVLGLRECGNYYTGNWQGQLKPCCKHPDAKQVGLHPMAREQSSLSCCGSRAGRACKLL